jgi:F-type H+-transporting ATPase subunit epsilon
MLNFKIITPDKIVFSEAVEQVSLTTTTGEITVLSHHIPLVTNLKPGEIRYKQNGEEKVLAIAGGFAEVRPGNELVVLADEAEYAHEINIEQAEEARARAAKLMEEVHHDDVEFATIQAIMEKELNRVRVGKKYRKIVV